MVMNTCYNLLYEKRACRSDRYAKIFVSPLSPTGGEAFTQAKVHGMQDIAYANYQSGQHTGCLQGVGIYNCFYAAPHGYAAIS